MDKDQTDIYDAAVKVDAQLENEVESLTSHMDSIG